MLMQLTILSCLFVFCKKGDITVLLYCVLLDYCITRLQVFLVTPACLTTAV